MKKKITIYFVLIFSLMFSYNCSKDYLDVQQKNMLTDTYYENMDGLRKYEIGMFTYIKDMYSYFPDCYYSGLTNEIVFTYTGGEGQSIREWSDLNPKSTNDFGGYLYGSYYCAIRMANIILEVADSKKGDIPEASPEEMNRILGGAYFIRAFSHFELMSYWGKSFDPTDTWGIILQTKPVGNRSEFQIARSKPSEVYAQIISDFKKAKELLPLEAEPAFLGYPTRGSATAFLGKMYLVRKDYAAAKSEFDLFFSENPSKGLVKNFGDIFHGKVENGIESVFEIQYSDALTSSGWGGGTGRPYQEFIGPVPLGRGNCSVGTFVYKFEKNDIRKIESSFSMDIDTIYKPDGTFIVHIDSINPTGAKPIKYKSAGNKYTPKKYINRERDNKNSRGNGLYECYENVSMMRVAEVYDMYAEVCAETGDLTKAYEYLNKVRRRAFGYVNQSSSPYDFAVKDKQDFYNNLYNEFTREFLGENLLWFNWLRWGIVEAEVAKTDRVFRVGTHEAMPIPQGEIRTDLLLKQNPGYE
jgi:starch-binding outer membrane protein, SusD/RagB family